LGPFGFTGGCFTDEPDRDGYTNNSVSARGGYRFGQSLDIELKALRAEGENEYDGNYLDPFFPSPNESKTVQQVAGTRVRYQAGDTATFTLNLGQSLDRSRNLGEGVFFSLFETTRDQGSLQADIELGGGTLSTGFDWNRDDVDSTTPYAVTARINRAVFGQWQQALGTHSLQASVRRDDNSQFGGKTTGSALWGWNFTEALRLTASYGTAFKAPTFNDLYFPLYDNPTLRPETSRSAELGLRGKHGWGGWSINAFQTRIEDLIVFDWMTTDATHPFGMPINVGEARIRGVELTGDTQLAGWDLRGSANWLDPRSESAPNDDHLLPRRARRSGRLDADRRFGDFSVGASVTAAGRRFDDLANTRELGGYATTDLRAGYRFGQAWNLVLSVNNVFDKSYETARFFNQLGRNYLLTLGYRPAD
ncbi:MAG TPA: TonB-dependent receptor, partial [Lysobacter sp.]|nr:TonB-dependent receptor [Lysobacter sp.]